MRKRWRLLWLLGLIAQVLIWGAVVWEFGLFGPTTWSIEHTVTKLGPPPGSSSEQVIAWLDSRHLRHGCYETDLDMDRQYPENAYPAEVYGASTDDLDGAIVARIPEAATLDPFGEEIALYFFFDKDGRLVKHVVKSWWYYL